MIKFFRNIRRSLINESKTSKYLKYAIGEIILVVIGILLALQINNWNTNRLQENNIKNYYKRIIIELDAETENAIWLKKNLDTFIIKNRKALRIIDSKNLDSVITLKKLLGATATSWDVTYEFPITKEFIHQNYLSKIDNDSIKKGFLELNSLFEYSESLRSYNKSQYVNTIEPFFIKNINYSETALPEFAKGLIQGGPKTNYEDLLTNLELWNIITFKLESLTTEFNQLSSTIELFTWFKEQLKKELNS